jgi:pimeloyl-ACP methyl ester carboxylesterase
VVKQAAAGQDGQPPSGAVLSVDGRTLFLDNAGSGGPTIVFIPGAGLVGLDYLNVCDRAAQIATSIVYDRGGTGWSDDVALPRSAEAVAQELRHLLVAADAPSPYLLVGHSLGAFYARRFAQLFPGEVAGLLLLDPGHEDIFDFLPPEAEAMSRMMKQNVAELSDLTEEQMAAARGQFEKIYAAWPPATREALIRQHLANWRTGLTEAANMEDEIYPEMRKGGPLPDVPLILLTAKGPNPFWAKFLSEQQMKTALDGVHALHASIVASVRQGEHRGLDRASHQYLHVDQPDAVMDAIRDLVAWINSVA